MSWIRKTAEGWGAGKRAKGEGVSLNVLRIQNGGLTHKRFKPSKPPALQIACGPVRQQNKKQRLWLVIILFMSRHNAYQKKYNSLGHSLTEPG